MKTLMVCAALASLLSSAEAWSATKTPKNLFSLFEDGGEHPANCNRERRLPKKVEKKEEFKRDRGYLGSLQVEFADKNEAAIDAWKHFFNNQTNCKVVEARLNESYEQGEEDL